MNTVEDKGLQEWRETVKRLEEELLRRIETARFNQKSEEHLSGLVDESYPLVKHYATEKLARNIYDCIEWVGEDPRQETDWHFAEYSIDTYLGSDGIREFAEKGIVLCTYSILPEDLMKSISVGRRIKPRDNFHLIHHGGIQLWLPYKEQLRKLSNEILIAYLDKGQSILPENMDFFLGRSVFEIYQRVKNGTLPKNYGEVKFH